MRAVQLTKWPGAGYYLYLHSGRAQCQDDDGEGRSADLAKD